MDNLQKNESVRKKHLSKITGSLIGGAIGDALGYEVEFQSEAVIFHKFGEKGITNYSLDPFTGKALISDDTQMTLFTACGLLNYDAEKAFNNSDKRPSEYVAAAYRDWLLTQNTVYKSRNENNHYTRLWNVPELFSQRAPGITCLNALYAKKDAFDDSPAANNSKGCGGVMRVAPVGLFFEGEDVKKIDRLAGDIAAITHGHTLGYTPAALLAHIVHRCVYPQRSLTLRQIVEEALDTTAEIYSGKSYIDELTTIINLAIELSENYDDDLKNIHRIGEGWVGEEALAIAVYCALRYHNNFDKCIITAVNHKGDSDSTGAIAGNILGAWLGMDAISTKWTRDLELKEVIEELAEDLCFGCNTLKTTSKSDDRRAEKYLNIN